MNLVFFLQIKLEDEAGKGDARWPYPFVPASPEGNTKWTRCLSKNAVTVLTTNGRATMPINTPRCDVMIRLI
jgi:hypothetical protein